LAHITELADRDDWLPVDDIACALSGTGYIVLPNIIPEAVLAELADAVQDCDNSWKRAGIGRGLDEHTNQFVRRDKIAWLDPEQGGLSRWFAATNALRLGLNRRLFLGLWDFECHLAHYAKGDFYKRHYDAFRGRSNRRVSLVAYLNNGWAPDQGGELVLYPGDSAGTSNRQIDAAPTTLIALNPPSSIKVTPLLGTVVLFLSEEIPHEVLPVTRDRYSVAGWFRVNDTLDNRLDPPH